MNAPAARFLRLSAVEVGRLPLYVQEELYRMNMRLEQCIKASRRMRGKTPDEFTIATVSRDLEQRMELSLDGAIRWQFGRKWSNAIDVRRGLIDRNTIRVTAVGGALVLCPDTYNAVTIRREEDR